MYEMQGLFVMKFYKDVAKALIGIVLILVLCRFTMGGMAALLALIGFVAALTRKSSIVVCVFVLFPLFVIFNRAIIGVGGLTLLIAKFAFIAMAISSFVSTVAKEHVRERLPIVWIGLYLVFSCISSIDGWMPLISFLKILNFAAMLMGIYMLSQELQTSFESLRAIRAIFMAIAIIIIIGSVISYFVPSIGYSMLIFKLEGYGQFLTAEELLSRDGKVLFNGMTCHSQMLSPVVACLATWVLCDMLLIEKRMSLLHCIILAFTPILLYMSRSRGGLLMLVCVIVLTLCITIPKARLSDRVKHHMCILIAIATAVLLTAGVYSQLRSDTISRWLRKTDDVASDQRSLQEAFTGSRQALIEMNIRDFKSNPLFGKGFQVVDGMKEAYDAHQITWFSASVEKGVTPYVILGEAGLMGAIAFLVFLSTFYSACFKRGYMALMTNFTCFLVANLADSTFFSPSGLGGFMWTVACIGAFSTDCLAKRISQVGLDEGFCWEPMYR